MRHQTIQCKSTTKQLILIFNQCKFNKNHLNQFHNKIYNQITEILTFLQWLGNLSRKNLKLIRNNLIGLASWRGKNNLRSKLILILFTKSHFNYKVYLMYPIEEIYRKESLEKIMWWRENLKPQTIWT